MLADIFRPKISAPINPTSMDGSVPKILLQQIKLFTTVISAEDADVQRHI